MTRGEGYYRVWKEVDCFEVEFIRQYRDDFLSIEEEEHEDWISEKIQEYLDEWLSMGCLSYREKMAIISNYDLCEALALLNDKGTSIHVAICPEDALIYAIIKEECRIIPDDFKKDDGDGVDENDEKRESE